MEIKSIKIRKFRKYIYTRFDGMLCKLTKLSNGDLIASFVSTLKNEINSNNT